MSHFAEVIDGIVQRVIVAEQDFINSGAVGNPANWIQTSYNTQGGEHPRGTPLHKNYASAGYRWDGVGFIPPQPYPSWKLNSNTYQWEAPTPMPADCQYCGWNEELQQWVNALDPQLNQAIEEAKDEFGDRN